MLPGLILDDTTKHLPIDSEYFNCTNFDNAGMLLLGPPKSVSKCFLSSSQYFS